MSAQDDHWDIIDENGEHSRREAFRRLKCLREGRALTDLEELIFLRQIQTVFPANFPPAEPEEQPPSGRMTAIRIKAPRVSA